MILLVCFVSTTLLSQVCPPTPTGSTKTLDWENATTFTCYLPANNGNPTTLTSPFFQSGLGCNDNIWPFCNPSYPNKDISSADGWRYVTHDFGTPTKLEDCPVFVLYNIYSGMLRVFFYKNIPTLLGNSSVISLEYKESSKRTALLGNYRGRLKDAVQVFDNGSSSGKPVIIPNIFLAAAHWTHADFTTQYAPCTCASPNAYTVKLVTTQTSNVSFTLNGQTKQEIKADQTNGVTNGLTVKNATDGLSIIKSLFSLGAGSAPNSYSNVFNDLAHTLEILASLLKRRISL